jgi:5-methylcytosine-specific restriction endonuclease McrBC GTP-binding regulatory subunit McrB
MAYIQKILFGSPGTGKSHKVDKELIPNTLKITSSENKIKTVFHPEYTYGDFLGKLVPHTKDNGKVEYKFFEGHFLIALAKALKNIHEAYDKDGQLTGEIQNVVLVIDEINRGNSAAIFGTVFQLLDREDDGWSSYDINITQLEFLKLLELIGVKFTYDNKGEIDEYKLRPHDGLKQLKSLQDKIPYLNFDLVNRKVKIPPNLSIIGTMNTSDNSIYFMDSAFKRRWDWEFIDINPPAANYFKDIDSQLRTINRDLWKKMVDAINDFIKSHSDKIRRIEDKQIGYYFIKGDTIQHEAIRNKLMFFLWDSVFSNEKKPLLELLNSSPLRANNPIAKNELVTFGDFVRFYKEFNAAIIKKIGY